ncbi:MAG: uracil-DNA glycosylase [Veillonellaceae bacterium]|uniref:uracil-DNA glycosylase n=1 Tax=Anaerovibrio lipolyticus TaxID=82374 RepID=UPI001F489FC1|nr:uracil-DNA glycosylase [Anaerovibrio lipolyticus]MCI6911040.1 uracil-DNA glycosylase [Veillonellaceae bacterium]MDY4486318.1 uracil-DNA glycosylase [Anaerovibrio sp.]MCF2601521.1 uracil-DNA glycosylase [Anaerovibrio lipolyticus]MCI7078592.1 uracil-DNA glycosylase [Veillonellaceae bacterium]MCI7090495.1 uracil-DNA glycosylase [Veillonellaceae bacterium]
MEIFKNDWGQYLKEEMAQPYYRQLRQFLIGEYSTKQVYPDMYSIFNALHYTSYADTKVLILGQDPYHEPGQAHGLSFSVQPNVPPPPSLVNIFKELETDLGCTVPNNGCLEPWARQGVLLLNTVLTVQAHRANSHRDKGWEIFTDKIISLLNQREKPVAFILWGSPARRKKAMITNPQHFIVESPHPSPLSAYRGFFGSRPFSKVNKFLESVGEEPINWQLPNI